tara:strand:- start:892 stop:1209 length:318 start_codon:yes stop_codon:yes gene_type:complete
MSSTQAQAEQEIMDDLKKILKISTAEDRKLMIELLEEQQEKLMESKAKKNPPICCGVGGTNDCDKPCDIKYIGNKKSEMWGETDEFAKHPYHWNQCGECFEKDSE